MLAVAVFLVVVFFITRVVFVVDEVLDAALQVRGKGDGVPGGVVDVDALGVLSLP